MVPQQTAADYIRQLADNLDLSLDRILLDWRSRVEQDPELTTAFHLSRKEFEDNIPPSLQLLGQQLRRLAVKHPHRLTEKVADQMEATDGPHSAEHGQQRWEHGYDLPELIREWGHLHGCLLKVVVEFESSYPNPPLESLQEARALITSFVHAGITNSVTQYFLLQKSEAAEIVRELQAHISTSHITEVSRGHLMRQVVHDLRNNLAVVQAAGNILRAGDKPVGEEIAASAGELLQRSALSQYDMLSELLHLSRLESGIETREIAPFDAGLLLKEFAEQLVPLGAEKGLTVSWQGSSSLPAWGDAAKVQRIAQNLLLNAIHYTERGFVKLSWGRQDDLHWFFRVEDSGPGFSGHPVQDPNQPVSRGEGIGLVIVRRLCRLLDGTVEFSGDSGNGTQIQVTFPTKYPDNRQG